MVWVDAVPDLHLWGAWDCVVDVSEEPDIPAETPTLTHALIGFGVATGFELGIQGFAVDDDFEFAAAGGDHFPRGDIVL